MSDNDQPRIGAGRPLKFENIDELKRKIDAYFDDCDPHPIEVLYYEFEKKTKKKKIAGVEKTVQVDDHSKPPIAKTKWVISDQKIYTITGLAMALDTNRQTLLEYEGEVPGREKADPEFADTIKKAKLRIEHYWENKLDSTTPTGTIFNLKNNYGWKDKNETDLTSNGKTLKGATIEFGNPDTKAKDTSTDVS